MKIGTCALTVVVYKDNLIVGNCGDSQVIVVKENDNEKCVNSNSNNNHHHRINYNSSNNNNIINNITPLTYFNLNPRLSTSNPS